MPYSQPVLPTRLKIPNLLLLLALPMAAQTPGADLDHDGIADRLEQQLLEKFRPDFRIGAADCDTEPAEFRAGAQAVLYERNGSIYGQVFVPPSAVANAPGLSGAVLEIHYYDLWTRDCGRMSHALDPEHVAVLVHAPRFSSGVEEWRAAWWYAAAHEHTVCDRSSIAPATSLEATGRGATFWISSGKHAAYLSDTACAGGCGDDRCDHSVPLPPGKLINLGELQAPMNGAAWTASRQWTLAEKMQSSFPPQALAAFPAGSASELVADPSGSLQSVISAGDSSLNALGESERQTSSALTLGKSKTEYALGNNEGKVNGSLRTAFRKVKGWLHR